MLRRPAAYRAITIVAALAVGRFYLWCAQATNDRFTWKSDLPGFYNLLGRGFAGGHLYFPVEPSPELLALPDPWDAKQNEPYILFDAVLFNKHYYLYHGAAPAVMFFLPWRLLTGHDVPEAFAAFVFCFCGYLFSCALLMRMLRALDLRPSAPMFALLVLALGICPSIPFLLHRVLMYEVAIAGGYFCVAGGFYFLARGLEGGARRPIWLALAGLLLGLAIGCRPHLGLAAVCAGVLVWWRNRRSRPWAPALAFAIPVAACTIAIAAYNYGRFGDPLEFGLHYQLGNVTYRRMTLSRGYLLTGWYYLLLAPPLFEPVFPFVRLGTMLPFHRTDIELPEGFFLEGVAGALAAFPLAMAGFAAPLYLRNSSPGSPARGMLCALTVFSLAQTAFLAGIGFVSQRYTVDFLPSMVLAGCVGAVALLACLGGVARSLCRVTAVALLFYSVILNVSLGIQGPVDSLVEERPSGYVKIARWFSPVGRLRPLLNPKVIVEALFSFPEPYEGRRPLIGAGRTGSRYLLSATSAGGNRLRLDSEHSRLYGEIATADVTFAPGRPARVRLEYNPADRFLTIHWDGVRVLHYPLRFLVTAPGQVTVGEDRTETGVRSEPFPGQVALVQKIVSVD